LRDLNRMGEPCSEMIPLMKHKDLRLVFEAAKGR
jgi:hypothetical protein